MSGHAERELDENDPEERDRTELALQDAWFRAQGLTGPTVLEIHPEDEMARLDLQKTAPERRRTFYMRTGYEAVRVLEHALAAAGCELARGASLRAAIDRPAGRWWRATCACRWARRRSATSRS
ncbi:MAG: hypothetical protein HOP15_06280 [Planctomycetes bacterium]|nr:hypothetical protein [Planctomycetota bacterium]